MKFNMGTPDRMVRVSAAAIICAICLARIISGKAMVVLEYSAAMLAITGLISWCPLYAMAGISTIRKRSHYWYLLRNKNSGL